MLFHVAIVSCYVMQVFKNLYSLLGHFYKIWKVWMTREWNLWLCLVVTWSLHDMKWNLYKKATNVIITITIKILIITKHITGLSLLYLHPLTVHTTSCTNWYTSNAWWLPTARTTLELSLSCCQQLMKVQTLRFYMHIRNLLQNNREAQ